MKSLAQETGALAYFPQYDPGPERHLRRHLRRAVEPVFDRLRALELAPRRPLPPDHHQGERPPGISSAGADGVHRREHDLESRSSRSPHGDHWILTDRAAVITARPPEYN